MPIEALKWFKHGVELNFDLDEVKEKFEIKSNGTYHTLIVKDVQFDDVGEFSVEVIGTDAKSAASLSVTGLRKYFFKFKLS